MARVTWRNDLLASFAERDAREKAQFVLINEYTRLADRAASLSLYTDASAEPANLATSGASSNTTSTSKPPTTTAPPNSDLTTIYTQLAQVRTDLATSQRDRTTLQSQLTAVTNQLSQLQKSSAANLRELDKVKLERYHLEKKLRDRDEESKVNRKMIENLQDEIISLNIQLNIGDQAKQRMKTENEELIARWMALKKDEADAMNNNSRFS